MARSLPSDSSNLPRAQLKKRLLECGCGTATLARYMAQRGYECTMLDYSKKAIEIARTGFAARGLNGRFCVGDLNELGFETDSFDIVYSGGVLEFFADIRKPILEMVRVLKPGGVFAASMVPRKIQHSDDRRPPADLSPMAFATLPAGS